MDPLLSSTDLSSSKASGFAAGILSSLNSLFGSNAMGAGVFANLLAEEQGTVPIVPPPPPVDPSSTSTPNTALQGNNDSGNNDPSADASSIGSLNALITGLHRIINKLKGSDGGNTPSGNSQTPNTNAPTDTTTTAPQVQTTPATGTASSDTSSSGDASGSGSGATGPKTLADILSDLTALMKYMEKKLTAAQAGSGGTTTQTSDTADTASTSAADPLSQLLSLMQLIQQQLAGTAGGALSTASTATPGATSGSAPASPLSTALQDLLQLQKDLKGLMASLQDSSASSNSTGPASGGNTLGTADGLVTTDQTSTDTKPSLASADDFFSMFGNVLSNPFANTPPPGAFSSANVNALIAGTDVSGGPPSDASPNMAGQDGGASSADGGSANLNGLNANTAALSSGQADGSKSVDPYAFASQLSAARAANGGMTGLPDAVEQVLLQLNRGVKNGNDQMTIQLHPAELGKINVNLNISSDGQVRGTIVADNPSTLNMLHKDVRSLERALQEAGLRADPGSLQFSLGGQSGNTSGQTTNSSNSNASPDGSSFSDAAGPSSDASSGDSEIYYLTPGRVNMKV